MMRLRSLYLLGTLGCFLAASPSRPLAAQVGVDPARSPYRDIIRPNGWTLMVGHVYGDGGPLRISPNSGSSYGLRYDIKLSGLLQGFAELDYLALRRPLLLPDDSVVNRYHGSFDAPVWTPHIGMQINVTGAKSWHGLAPFVAAGLGAAVGEGVAQDTTAFKFGTKLLFTPSVGTRVFLGERLHVRVEGNLLYWKMKYPSGYAIEPAAQPSNPGDPTTAVVSSVSQLQDWVHTASLRVGIGLAF